MTSDTKTTPKKPKHQSSAADDARYLALAAHAAFGLFRLDPAGRFIECDQLAASILGAQLPSQVIGHESFIDIHIDPTDGNDALSVAGDDGLGKWMATRWRRTDGALVSVRVALRVERSGARRVTGYEGIVQDVTEERRTDEVLRRSERMASLGTTLAGVAHELNNPLAAIMGFTQLLLKKQWPAEDRAALETIHHEAIRSATLVRDLLAMARKRGTERRVRTDVNDVVGYIVRSRRYALETAGITCSLEFDPALPHIYGDRTQLEQVFLNLLNNAEQALHTRAASARGCLGKIRIRTRRDEDMVVVEVEDDGPGIPEGAQSRIWDPFWTTKEEGEGTGLGLAVVHGIVAEHGGTITFEHAPVSGARFVVHLPIAQESPAPVPSGQATKPLDVLIVDPGASDLMFVERFLTLRGHAVINATRPEAAMRLAMQTQFDAVVCDAHLRGADGSPVAEAIRATPGCAEARFVLSTRAADDDGESPSRDHNWASYVERPYDVEELRRLIEGD